MTINRVVGTCMLVHFGETEAHFPDAASAEAWIGKLDAGIRIHAIEEAQKPCWMAYCDTQHCLASEANENDDTIHILADTAGDAEHQLSDLQRTNDGLLRCYMCREDSKPASPAPTSAAWIDQQGDVWRLGEDGLMHAYETAPFSREYVEKKWGPLRPCRASTADHS